MNIRFYDSSKLTELDFLRKLLLVQFWAKNAENDPEMVFFTIFESFYGWIFLETT